MHKGRDEHGELYLARGLVTSWEYGSRKYIHEDFLDPNPKVGATLEKGDADIMAGNFLIILLCLMTLNIKQFSRKEVTVSDKLNAARQRNKKPKLLGYTTISLKPHSDVVSNGVHGTHSSPTPHWRRGHVRNYESGRKTWINPVLVNWYGGTPPDMGKVYKVKT